MRVLPRPGPRAIDRSERSRSGWPAAFRLNRPCRSCCAALLAPGCQLVPREQLDECHRLSQTLRSENAQLKDQMLALRSQNQISPNGPSTTPAGSPSSRGQPAARDQRQAYQDERTRLESAYKELRASLPGSPQPLSLKLTDADGPAHGPKRARVPKPRRIPDPLSTRTQRKSPGPKRKRRGPKRSEEASGIAVGCHGAAMTPGFPARPRALLAQRPQAPTLDLGLTGFA